jgi:hypothetical protein
LKNGGRAKGARVLAVPESASKAARTAAPTD